MSNPIQQAIEAIEQARTELEQYEEDATGEHYNSPRLNAALSALQSLQGVEMPELPPPFMAQYGRVSSEVYAPWAEQMQAYARAAVAAAMARGAVARVKDDMHWQDVELLTSLVNSNRIAPSESSALFRLLEQATQPDTMRQRLQQQCTEWKAYWRASDSHGVELTKPQAIELLQDALGVEVEIKDNGCETCDGTGMIGGPSFYAPDEGGVPCPDCTQPTQAEAPSEREALSVIAAFPITDEKNMDAVNMRDVARRAVVRAALATQQAGQEVPQGLLKAIRKAGFRAVLTGNGYELWSIDSTTEAAPQQAEALAKQERDREDAENYRWLCSHKIVPSPSLWDNGVGFVTPALPRKSGAMTKPELDAAIRAARSSEGGGK